MYEVYCVLIFSTPFTQILLLMKVYWKKSIVILAMEEKY